MLETASVIAFLATVDPARATAFYQDVLGLKLIEESPFALVLQAKNVMLRIQKVDRFTPHPFTSLGWSTPDIVGAVRALQTKGVRCERFDGMEQDADGIWVSPAGAKVAWFRDPDGNILSLTELAWSLTPSQ